MYTGSPVKEEAVNALIRQSETEIVRAVLNQLITENERRNNCHTLVHPIQHWDPMRRLQEIMDRSFPAYKETWLVAAPDLVMRVFNERGFQPEPQSCPPAPVYPVRVGHFRGICTVYQDPLMPEGQALLSGRGAPDDPGFIVRFWRYLTCSTGPNKIMSYFELVPPVRPPVRLVFSGA